MKLNIKNKVKIYPLKKVKTKGGDIFKIIDKNSKGFIGFSETYFSWINYGKIKAWKYHTKMTMNLVVPLGKVKFLFFDPKTKKFLKIIIGKNNYKRIRVKPGLWFGFKGMSKPKSLILNFSNYKFNKKEILRKKKEDINLKW
tara:strand:+ start:2317 stop:2742 length:426 start_codon:yes stop_codon:yes gene_type:complete